MAENKHVFFEMTAICVRYGRALALRDISMQMQKGELVSLIGANGSGKSTLLKAILGLHPACEGRIFMDGWEITRLPVEKIVAGGIAMVPEGRGIIPGMTVLENLQLGAFHRKDDISADLNAVYKRFPILKERQRAAAENLSGGQQQMLAVGRAIMAAPKLLLLDEPSLGLAPLAVDELFAAIREMKQDGYTILLAEQNAQKALGIADRAYVFETGRIVLEGKASKLREDPAVRQYYLGGGSMD